MLHSERVQLLLWHTSLEVSLISDQSRLQFVSSKYVLICVLTCCIVIKCCDMVYNKKHMSQIFNYRVY